MPSKYNPSGITGKHRQKRCFLRFKPILRHFYGSGISLKSWGIKDQA